MSRLPLKLLDRRKCIKTLKLPLPSYVVYYSRHFAWAGHLARLPDALPAKDATRARNRAWWRQRQDSIEAGRTDLRHPGRWRASQWEFYVDTFWQSHPEGPKDWMEAALDRDAWKAQTAAFCAFVSARAATHQGPACWHTPA